MKRLAGIGLTSALLALVLVTGNACGSDDSGTREHLEGSGIPLDQEGGDGAPGHAPGPQATEPPGEVMEITLAADEFSFTPDEIAIPSGETVMLTLTNEGTVEHDLQVDGLAIERTDGGDMAGDHEGAGEDMLALHTPPGERASLTFRTDEQGTFEFYCTIAGHRESGMVGELTVT